MIARAAAMAATAGLAVSIFVGQWFALYRYTPNGWEATWWARLALAAAAVNLALIALDRLPAARVCLAALAAAAVAVRAVWPPDFGLGFDGLEVPTERRAGIWVALALAVVALALELRRWRLASPTRARPAESSVSRS